MTEALTPQDEIDLALLNQPEPTKRSLLDLWTHIFSNLEQERENPVPTTVAMAVRSRWPWITFQEMPRYSDIYYDLLSELRVYLTEIVKEHPEAIAWVGDDDREQNEPLYRELASKWQYHLDRAERSWRAEHPESHIQIAVLPDIHAFLFGETGLGGHLDAIGVQISFAELIDAVTELREAEGE